MVDAYRVVHENIRMTERRAQKHRQRDQRCALTARPVVVDQPAFHEVDGRRLIEQRFEPEVTIGDKFDIRLDDTPVEERVTPIVPPARDPYQSSCRRFPWSAGSSATSLRCDWR